MKGRLLTYLKTLPSNDHMHRHSLLIVLIVLFQEIQSQNLADSASFYTSEFNRISKEHGTVLWGRPIGAPILFIDKNMGLAYLSQSTNDTNEIRYGNIFILPLDSEMTKTMPVVKWKNSTWVTVYLPYQNSKKERIEFIAHESFHCIQNELSIKGTGFALPHLSTAQGKTLMQIELIELLKAHQAGSNDEQRKKHIENALMLRTYRYDKFPEARSTEGQAEMSEGLAEYTGMTYAGYTRKELTEHYELVIKQLETLHNDAMYPYISGSLYAFLNDEKDSAWRKLIPERPVHEITASIYGVQIEENIKPIVSDLMKSPEYSHISELFIQNTSNELKKMFSRNQLVLLVKGSQLQLKSNLVVSVPEMGTVYNNVIISNEWGILRVEESGRVLISQDNEHIILNTDSSIMDEGLIKGPGWQLIMNKGWEIDKKDATQYLIISE